MTPLAAPYRPHVVLKLRAKTLPPVVAKLSQKLLSALPAPATPWLSAFTQVLLESQARFPGVTPVSLPWPFGKKSRRAITGRPLPEWLRVGGTVDSIRDATLALLRYCELVVPPGHAPKEVADWLRSQPGVEAAYVEWGPQPAPVMPLEKPPAAQQTYLEAAAKGGVDARTAWLKPGGKGQGVSLVDVEEGWVLDHVNLRPWQIHKTLFGLNRSNPGHGTAALGVVAAKPAGTVIPGVVDAAVTGIAHGMTRVAVSSPWRTASWFCKASAILHALESLDAGDVLLIEAQSRVDENSDLLPVEVEPAVSEVLQIGMQWGITIVEPAANGNLDLDTWKPDGRAIFDRNSPDFQDSGAILVGACSGGIPPTAATFSNRGSRVDCCGWGEHVFTTGFDDNLIAPGEDRTIKYLDKFGGTSSAAAMVAGVAAVVQGMEKRRSSRPFNPQRLRDILRDPANGTACNGPQAVGCLPDLAKIIANLGY